MYRGQSKLDITIEGRPRAGRSDMPRSAIMPAIEAGMAMFWLTVSISKTAILFSPFFVVIMLGKKMQRKRNQHQ